jgi:hypothetical protein
VEDGKHWRTERHSALVASNTDIIRTSKLLATVYREIPLTRIKPTPDQTKLVEAFKSFRFASFLRPSVLQSITKMNQGELSCQ